MNEKQWEKKYNINTSKTEAFYDDPMYHRYEPTSYSVLERIAESEYINKDDIVVDMGCGKGRTSIFLAEEIGCKCIGVDFDHDLIEQAQTNKGKRENVFFIEQDCLDYHFTKETVLYFFNPFSAQILNHVLLNLIDSYYAHPRRILCFFYYLDNESLGMLMNKGELVCIDQIDCSDLFKGNNMRECVFVFEIGGEE